MTWKNRKPLFGKRSPGRSSIGISYIYRYSSSQIGDLNDLQQGSKHLDRNTVRQPGSLAICWSSTTGNPAYPRVATKGNISQHADITAVFLCQQHVGNLVNSGDQMASEWVRGKTFGSDSPRRYYGNSSDIGRKSHWRSLSPITLEDTRSGLTGVWSLFLLAHLGLPKRILPCRFYRRVHWMSIIAYYYWLLVLWWLSLLATQVDSRWNKLL